MGVRYEMGYWRNIRRWDNTLTTLGRKAITGGAVAVPITRDEWSLENYPRNSKISPAPEVVSWIGLRQRSRFNIAAVNSGQLTLYSTIGSTDAAGNYFLEGTPMVRRRFYYWYDAKLPSVHGLAVNTSIVKLPDSRGLTLDPINWRAPELRPGEPDVIDFAVQMERGASGQWRLPSATGA